MSTEVNTNICIKEKTIMSSLRKQTPQPDLDVLDMNRYIKKSHITAVENFAAELERYKETCDPDGWLYKDPFTSFTLSDIHVKDGKLHYVYNGCGHSEAIVRYDKEEQCYYEDELDGIMDTVKFWSECLRRAQRYWSMDVDELDAIQNRKKDWRLGHICIPPVSDDRDLFTNKQ